MLHLHRRIGLRLVVVVASAWWRRCAACLSAGVSAVSAVSAVRAGVGGIALLAVAAVLASGCGGGPSETILASSRIEMTPTLLDFGTVAFGQAHSLEVTMKNLGDEPLGICLPLLASGDCPAPSAVGPSDLGLVWPASDMAWTLGAGERSTFTVGFVPAVAGDVTGSLVLHHHPAAGNGTAATLGGQSTVSVSASVGLPKLTLSKTEEIDFGAAALGYEKTETLVLTNETSPPVPLKLRFVAYPADPAAIFGVRLQDGTELDVNSTVELAAGEAIPATLWFKPTQVGAGDENKGRLEVWACSSSECKTTLALQGEGIRPEGSIAGDKPVDFGAHDVGASKEIQITVNSTGDAPLTVRGVKFKPDGNGLFTADHNDFPMTIEGHTSATIQLQHRGRSPVTDETTLTLVSDAAKEISVDLVASSNGPDIEVTPPALDFQAVDPLGSPVKKTVTITNQGDRTLTVSEIEVSGAGYLLKSPSSLEIAPNATGDVAVAFLPAADAEGPQDGKLIIRSNDYDQPVLEVWLVGYSGTPSGCSLQAKPLDVDFGAVVPGTTSYLAVEARNSGGAPCNVRSVALDSAGSEFALAESYSNISVPSGEAAHFIIAYSPSSSGSDSAVLRVSNGVGDDIASVNVVGTGLDLGLRAIPPVLDAGAANVGCFAPTSTLRLLNVSNQSLTVSHVYLDPYAPEAFEPSFDDSQQARLNVGQHADFNFRYGPTTTGDDTSVVYADVQGCAGCGSSGTKRLAIPIFGSGVDAGSNISEGYVQTKASKIDILFVVEVTNSMSLERGLLAAAFPEFLAQLRNHGVDYRIAVASTYSQKLQKTGSVDRITPAMSDEDAHSIFTEWLALTEYLGTTGAGLERALDTATNVLGVNGANTPSTFVRPDAWLSLVFLSEGEVSSDGTGDADSASKIDLLRTRKYMSGLRTTISAIALTPGESCNDNGPFGYNAPTLIQATKQTGGVAISICGESADPGVYSYLPNMRLLAMFGAGATLRFPLRGQSSSMPTVRVNGVLTSDFFYDAYDRSVLLSKEPSFGDRIDFEYGATCISN
ncbi:MAG: choice-of-anchor D domain-containing protein [Deltaproteobacteria bacterium]|nr:choice-of-anchor D domain-containing protein [Deltaproteobacteria bacterium]